MQTRHSSRGSRTITRDQGKRSLHTRDAVRTVTPVEALILAVCVIAVTAAFARGTTVLPAHELPTTNIKVHVTQTLWDIASAHPIDGLTTPQTVDRIKQINGLTSSQLHIGQELAVPCDAGSSAAVAAR